MKNLESLKSLTILYVEDENLIRQNAVEYLSYYCDKIYEAQNGEEALKIYNNNKIDIIITDIKMPKMSGLNLAQTIRKNDKKIPILITTAHTDTNYLLKAVELQLIKYIVKPITSDKLNEGLQMALDTLNEPTDKLLKLDSKIQYDILNKSLFINNKLTKLTYNEQLLLVPKKVKTSVLKTDRFIYDC